MVYTLASHPGLSWWICMWGKLWQQPVIHMPFFFAYYYTYSSICCWCMIQRTWFIILCENSSDYPTYSSSSRQNISGWDSRQACSISHSSAEWYFRSSSERCIANIKNGKSRMQYAPSYLTRAFVCWAFKGQMLWEPQRLVILAVEPLFLTCTRASSYILYGYTACITHGEGLRHDWWVFRGYCMLVQRNLVSEEQSGLHHLCLQLMALLFLYNRSTKSIACSVDNTAYSLEWLWDFTSVLRNISWTVPFSANDLICSGPT